MTLEDKSWEYSEYILKVHQWFRGLQELQGDFSSFL